MRRAARVDQNQSAIVAALRASGASVQLLHAVGAGCPDLVVGRAGRNWLLEVKNPARVAKRGTIRPTDEMHGEWHSNWRGQVSTVWTIDQALAVVYGPE